MLERWGMRSTPSLTSLRGPVGWGCRIHHLHLCKGARLPQRVPWYDTKQSDRKTSVMLELWAMWSCHLLPPLPGPLWPGMVSADRVQSMGQIELNGVITLQAETLLHSL